MTAATSFKERVRQERRAEILRATRLVVNERGYQATSIEDIAERAGVGKGTVYLHFSSKDDLLIALWEETEARLEVEVSRVLEDAESPLLGLVQGFNVIAEFSQNNLDVLTLFMAAPPEFRERLREHCHGMGPWRSINKLLAGAVERGQAAGEIVPWLHPEVTAAVLPMLTMLPLKIGEVLRTEAPDPSEIQRMLNHIFRNGIATQAPNT